MLPASVPAPPYVASAINAAAARSSILRLDVRWYASVTSTMDLASEAVQAGAPEGLVIVADEQTAGRGRRGHEWSSPAGAGISLSFVLRPPLDTLSTPPLALLTLATGVAVRDAIMRATGFAPDLKWPNDIIVGKRKLAGILAEGSGIGTALQTVILGIGINVWRTSHPADIAERATSLDAEVGRPVDRTALLEELLVMVPAQYDRLRCGDVDGVLRAWREASPGAQGSSVAWDTAQGPRRGVTAGIDDSGALLIRTGAGVERVIAGEVKWL